MVHVVIDRHFSLFLKGLKIFLSPRLSLIFPLKRSIGVLNLSTFCKTPIFSNA